MRFNTSINNVKCLEWGINANQGALFDLLYQASSWAETVWKINKPKNIKEADQIIKKCKKILEILESE